MCSARPRVLTDRRSTTTIPVCEPFADTAEGRARGLLPSAAVGRAQRFEVTVEGRSHEVSVELDHAGVPLHVRVDDTACTVQLGADDTLIVRPGDEEGRQHVVHLSPGRRPAHAAVGSLVVSVEVKSAREAALGAALAQAGRGSGTGTIEAPMPGRVVRVLVTEGETIEVDAPLLIVEAMKMENEVLAPIAGTVRRMAVAVGDTVESGQLLCELEPLAQAET